MADVPNTSGTAPVTSGAAPVTDRRPVPRGVLPRGTQTWLMAAVALGMLLVIFVAGRPEPAPPAAAAMTSAPTPSPERVRDYQDRLRALDARAAQEAQAAALAPAPPAPAAYADTQAPVPQDAIVAERRRREYESLFSSNVVLSRRPEDQRPDSGRATSSTTAIRSAPAASPNASIDDIADAALRATLRAGATQPGSGAALPAGSPPTTNTAATSAVASSVPVNAVRPMRTEAISAAGPLHQILAGTVIDAVLTNRLDGGADAPVNCLVTNPVYSHSRQHVLIPAGARLLGETKPVQALGETRLAVAFNRLVMPDGSTQSLDSFLGLNQIGDAGLRDQVDHHYRSTFGAAGAVGLISGLAQFLGTAGLGRGDGDRTVIIAGGASDATAQASLQVMNRFLNRMPTITIREGHRVKVYLTSDLELPAYTGPAVLGK
jgi:type IV secretion system protein VirB10